MTDASDRAEYEQYLKETGQAAKSKADIYKGIKSEADARISPENVGAAANNAAALMSGGLTEAIPALGKGVMKYAAPYLEGGVAGAAQSPDDRLGGFLKGGLIQGGLSTAGKIAGPIGDRAMQFAVGRKKFTPGVGNELADAGLWGTKGMMRDQVASKADDAWKSMESAAENVPAVNSRQIGQDIYTESTRPLTGGGTIKPSSRDVPLMAKNRAFAEDIASRGQETGEQALARRGAAGKSAFSAVTDQPLQKEVAKLSKMEQAKYSADNRYSALKRAEKPLNEEERIGGLGDLVSATAKHLSAPIASAVGQVGTKGGALADFLAPIARQTAVSGTPADPQRAEYEQYLKETGQK
jgi:hypothetical protein